MEVAQSEAEEEGPAGEDGVGTGVAGALKGDEAWTPDEEQELLRLASDEAYRKARLGEASTKWGPIALHFQRTVKAVKRKFDKLQALQDRGADPMRRGRREKTYPEAEAALQRLAAEQHAQHAQQAAEAAEAYHHLSQQLGHALPLVQPPAGEAAQLAQQAEQQAAAGMLGGPGHELAAAGQHAQHLAEQAQLAYHAGLADRAVEAGGSQEVQLPGGAFGPSPEQQDAAVGHPGQPPEPPGHGEPGPAGEAEEEAAAQHAQQEQQHEQQQHEQQQAAAMAAALEQHHQQHYTSAMEHLTTAGPELLAGMYLDPSLGAAMPLLAAHQLSPEDAAVLQAMPGGVAGLAISSGLPPHLATAAHGGVMPLDAAALAAQAAHAAAAVAGGPGAGAGPSGDAAAAAAAAALHAQAEAQMQLLQAHTVDAGHSPSDGAAVGGEGSSASAPKKDRQFWSQQEQQDLLRLATDPTHRQAVLGCAELNWDLVAKHLGRGKRSVQRKYDNLRTGMQAAGGAAPVVLPSKDGQKWTPEEVAELTRLVEDPAYLKERLGLDKIDWRVLGQHFNRSYETVSYKVSYMKNTQRKAGVGPDGQPLDGRQHKKARHETSYKDMAAHALQVMPNLEGTSGEICQIIQSTPQFLPQLDMAIVSGKKTLPRWKHGVRSALNAFNIFERTGALREGEVVWRLNQSAMQQEQLNQAEKAERMRNKPMSGAARRKMRREREEAAAAPQGQLRMVDVPDAQPEEGAQQALAQLAQQAQVAERPRRKRKASAVLLAGGEYVQGGEDEGEVDDGGLLAGTAGVGADGAADLGGASEVPLADAAAQQAAALQGSVLHPDALAAMMAAQHSVPMHLDPGLLQVFSEQAQQAAAAGIQPADLAAQQQFAAQQAQHMAQQAQQHMGYLMPAGLSPEFQQQYQAQMAQHFMLMQQHAAQHAEHVADGSAMLATHDPTQPVQQDGAGVSYEHYLAQHAQQAGGAAQQGGEDTASYLQALQGDTVLAASQGLAPGMHPFLLGQHTQHAQHEAQHPDLGHVQMYLPHQQGGPADLGAQEQMVGVLPGTLQPHAHHLPGAELAGVGSYPGAHGPVPDGEGEVGAAVWSAAQASDDLHAAMLGVPQGQGALGEQQGEGEAGPGQREQQQQQQQQVAHSIAGLDAGMLQAHFLDATQVQ